MAEAEFKVGDKVTFNAYLGRVHKAKVREVYPPCPNAVFFKDDFSYKVKGEHILSVTTGRSLMESKFFEPPTQE